MSMVNPSAHNAGAVAREIFPTVSVGPQDVSAGEQITWVTGNNATSITEMTIKAMTVFADIIQSTTEAQLQTR